MFLGWGEKRPEILAGAKIRGSTGTQGVTRLVSIRRKTASAYSTGADPSGYEQKYGVLDIWALVIVSAKLRIFAERVHRFRRRSGDFVPILLEYEDNWPKR